MTDPKSLPLKERRRENARALIYLGKELTAPEAALHHSKWYDYRFITPIQATMLFAEEYTRCYQDAWRANIDDATADKKLGRSAGAIKLGSREFTCLWKARQQADAIGAPYRQFINQAMTYLLRNNWKRIPRPNQLVPSKCKDAILSHIREHLDEWRTIGKPWSALPVYHVDAYQKLPAQNAHRDYVLSWVRQKSSRPDAIALTSFVERVLPESMARRAFGDDVMDESATAKDDYYSATAPRTLGLIEAHDTWPSCFGLLGASNPDTSECSACPFKDQCHAEASCVEAVLVKKFGEADPRAGKRRRATADRVRKHRAKKAAEATSSAAVA